MAKKKIEELTEEDLKEIFACGRVGLTYREVAYNSGLLISDVKKQFIEEEGVVFEQWELGRLQAELEIRQQVLESAKNGSTPAIEKMIDFFKKADLVHRELIS